MKTKLLFIIPFMFLFGCKAPKQATKTQPIDDKLVPFTQQMIVKYNLTSEDLKKVQFYNSDVVKINTLEKNKDVTIEGGDIKVTNKDVPTEVKVEKNTPGVVEILQGQSPSYTFFIRFEQDGANRYLPFMLTNDGMYHFATQSNGTIMYDGKPYKTVPENGDVYLMVNVDESFGSNPKRRIAPGVKIGTSTGSYSDSNNTETNTEESNPGVTESELDSGNQDQIVGSANSNSTSPDVNQNRVSEQNQSSRTTTLVLTKGIKTESTMTFSWNNNISGAMSYSLFVKWYNTDTHKEVNSELYNGTDQSYTVTKLKPGSTYYIVVRALDNDKNVITSSNEMPLEF